MRMAAPQGRKSHALFPRAFKIERRGGQRPEDGWSYSHSLKKPRLDRGGFVSGRSCLSNRPRIAGLSEQYSSRRDDLA